MNEPKALGHLSMVEYLEGQIRENLAEGLRLEHQRKMELEALQEVMAEDGVGAVVQRADGRYYVLSDTLADGRSCVKYGLLEERANFLRRFDLAPREVTTTQYPTIAQIKAKRRPLHEAGFDWRDLIDEAPKRTGLRLQTIHPDEEEPDA